MNNLLTQKQIPLKWLIGLSVVFLLIILVAGLKPKGFRFFNMVSWIKSQPGIRFSRIGIAHTNPSDDPIVSRKSDTDGFSIEIALKPGSHRGRRFKIIMAFHDGKDSDQLVMGQWRSQIIVMKGDDYAYRRKTKRIAADATDAASLSPTARLVTITTGQEGTKIYLDGKLESTKKNLRLKMPPGANARLLLGNSVYGKHPWRGDIYGLALYNFPLSPQKAALHFNRWSKDQNFSFARNENPSVIYLFDEKGGTRALDHSGGKHHLEIPLKMRVFERQVLTLPSRTFMSRHSFIKDIVVNLLGFIPFGFVLFATLIRFGGTFDKHAIIFTVILCFFVSLSIEILQAWILSRTSNILDLVLNTLGGLSGAIVCKFIVKLGIWRPG